ncbi:MAG TPA: transcriptional regulator NrdR [Planctomycetota bacterium]|nr:transcriptional regulator NrdR [Planctomycetota bacterium]
MQCPFCKNVDDRVVDSRLIGTGRSIRRRRECLGCGKRFTTYEHIQLTLPMVIKKDSRREVFQPRKILDGLVRACNKRGISRDELETIVEKVECWVLEDCGAEVESRAIGEKVSEHLRSLDPVAFVRFASVYREFDEVEQFLDEVRRLASRGVATAMQS